ncbi:hemoglobin subunit beta-1-like [Podarcis lilfordi]|uniref:Hemoglobin subunit beta-1-like n=1 Tax=Podarcis lilfordi TaxID=74358 RepID=A0AA35KAX9_9SAUR|nr:hemoglobin subunit beta-1-like [Podarcis lilfordi]
MVHWTAEEKQLINTFWSKVNVADLAGWAGTPLSTWIITIRASPFLLPSFLPSLQLVDRLPLDPAFEPLQISLHKVKEAFSELRELLCDKLHVDPVNVRHQSEVLITLLAADFGKEFSPAYHHAFHKLVGVVAHALACRSH